MDTNRRPKPRTTSTTTKPKVVETKRTKRERKQVTLMSKEYLTIYDNANNRKGRNKPATVNKKQDKSNKQDKPDKPDKADKPDKELKKKLKQIISTTTTYQWIGQGTPGSKEEGKENCLYFQKLEMKVGNHPALIQIGDDVLLSRGDEDEEDVFDKTTLNGSVRTDSNRNVDKSEVAMNSLNPYVGKVIAMWEEDAVETDCSSVVKHKDERRTRMKALIQWYYTRYDVLCLKGQFEGYTRENISSIMQNPRMLLFGKNTDENEVSTILGKCHVSRNAPFVSGDCRRYQSNWNPKDQGSFFCDFDLIITPGSKASKNKITIIPYKSDNDIEEDTPPAKKSRTSTTTGRSVSSDDHDTQDASSTLANDSVAMGDAPSSNANSQEENDDESSMEDLIMKEPTEFKHPTSEGNATQKIMIGDNHQAVIPPLDQSQGRSERYEPSILVWKPDSISDTKFQKFMKSVHQFLITYMKSNEIEVSRSIPPKLNRKHLPSNFTCREIKMDEILKLLHDKAYNTDAALKAIKASPQAYLDSWSKREIELYNVGFKRHFSAIRLIAKGIGPTKSHKEVVDYHYRYKIPDQFRRYQDQKRELAKRMLDCIEKHRLGEYLSTESSQFVNNASNGTKKLQNWAKTGGTDTKTIGNIEARRLSAKHFLIVLKDTVGVEKYLKLVTHLKSLHARSITIPECRDVFRAELKEHPELLEQFDGFLPKEFRA